MDKRAIKTPIAADKVFTPQDHVDTPLRPLPLSDNHVWRCHNNLFIHPDDIRLACSKTERPHKACECYGKPRTYVGHYGFDNQRGIKGKPIVESIGRFKIGGK